MTNDRQPDPSIESTIEETEQWFIHQGLPHFIANYTATEKVLPRAVSVLTLAFLVSVTTVVSREWPLWRNVLAILAAFLVLVGIWVAVNRVRGLPALRPPETVGPVEVGVFLFGPAVLALLMRDPRGAVVTVLVNVVQLAFIYYSTSYGLVPLAIWNVRLVIGRLGLALRLVAHTLPVLLLAVTFLMFNGAAWESITRTPLLRYVALLVLFQSLTLVFAYRAVVVEYERIPTLESRDEIEALCADSPAGRLATTTDVIPSEVAPLARTERTNVLVMATASSFGYVMVVTLVMLVFFLLFGLLAIPDTVVSDLIGAPPEPLFTVTFFEAPVTLTRELVRVSGFLAVFSGLYFAIHAVTDHTFRRELDGDIVAQVKQALAVRAVYRTLLDDE